VVQALLARERAAAERADQKTGRPGDRETGSVGALLSVGSFVIGSFNRPRVKAGSKTGCRFGLLLDDIDPSLGL
jgi:hypothetical protein